MEPANILGPTPPLVNEEVIPEAVRTELRNVVMSRPLRSSKRGQQFLEFVVEQKLVGNELLIKERLIGVEVFGRSVDYAAGDDPVVRVQASEVRRRLDAYRMDCQEAALVTIELPTGSYVPIIRQRSLLANEDSLVASPSEGGNQIRVITHSTHRFFRWNLHSWKRLRMRMSDFYYWTDWEVARLGEPR